MPRIITRAEWGARPPRKPMTRVPWADRLGTCVHYTGGNRDDTPAELQAYAQDSLGYIDGHYNLLVDYLGNAYEGRGIQYSAAHSEGENRTHVGVAFIGRDGDVTPAAEAAIADLVAEINRQAGRVLPELKGHQEMPGAQTSCPGPRLMGLVNRLRSGGDDMTPEQDSQLRTLYELLVNGVRTQGSFTYTPAGGKSQPINPLYNAIWQVGEKVGAEIVMPDVDEEAIVRGILATLTPQALADALSDEVAQDVVDLLAARLAS